MSGLAERIVELRAARNSAADAAKKAPQLTQDLTPKPVLELKPVLAPTPPNPEEQAIEAEKQRILEHFGVREKLEEIRDKYWQCGEVFPIKSGFRLMHISETSGYGRYTGRTVLEESPGYSGSRDPNSSGNPSSHIPIYRPPTFRWVSEREWKTDQVRNIIQIQILELPPHEQSADQTWNSSGITGFLEDNSALFSHNLVLAVAIGIDPESYNRCLRDSSIKELALPGRSYRTVYIKKTGFPSTDPLFKPIEEEISAKEYHKHLERTEDPIFKPVYLFTRLELRHREDDSVPNLDVISLIMAIQNLGSQRFDRLEYKDGHARPGKVPDSPWAVYLGYDQVGKFGDFLAQYIVNTGLDIDPLVRDVPSWYRK